MAAEAAPARQQAARQTFAHPGVAERESQKAKQQARQGNGGKGFAERHAVAEHGAEHKLIERGQHAHMHDSDAKQREPFARRHPAQRVVIKFTHNRFSLPV